MGDTKQRAFRFTAKLLDELTAEAARRNISVSALAESILAEALSKPQEPPPPMAPAAAPTIRPDVETQIKELRYELGSLGELVSFFIYQWLCYTPPVADEIRAQVTADAKPRHKRFLQIVSAKIARSKITLADLLSAVAEAHEQERKET
jgi:hypothetical protein